MERKCPTRKSEPAKHLTKKAFRTKVYLESIVGCTFTLLWKKNVLQKCSYYTKETCIKSSIRASSFVFVLSQYSHSIASCMYCFFICFILLMSLLTLSIYIILTKKQRFRYSHVNYVYTLNFQLYCLYYILFYQQRCIFLIKRI